MNRHLFARRRLGVIALVAALSATAYGIGSQRSPAATSDAVCPTSGVGDRLHPTLGIPGVRVRSTQTHLVVASGLVSYTALTQLNLVATRPLRCAALDYAHGHVLGAEFDGHATSWKPALGKVVVNLGTTVDPGTRFDVVVRTDTDVPTYASLPHGQQSIPPGVFRDGGVLQEIGQPSRAHYLVPMADYPAQKAPWRVVVDVPHGMTLAFTGHTISTRTLSDGERRIVAASDGPIAPDVLQLAVGRLRLVRGPTVDGVHLRSYLPPSAVAGCRRALALLPGDIRTMTRVLGRFPFPQYGMLATPKGGDLEDQTLSLFSTFDLEHLYVNRAVIFHEMVHQWFGDSVSIRDWSDLWLAEGHAVYYTGVYAYRSDRRSWESQYRFVRRTLPSQGPVAEPRRSAFKRDPAIAPYGYGAYEGGAVALYALRTRIGPSRFDRIERTFVTRYRNESATTQDYLQIVGQVAGTATRTWFHRWLYSTDLPSLPNA